VPIDQAELILDTVVALRDRQVNATAERVTAFLDRVDADSVRAVLDDLVARRKLERNLTYEAWEGPRSPTEPTVVAYTPLSH
jgi:hypothetical protein